jgi:tetratricopeptide (TPR) repeat protein
MDDYKDYMSYIQKCIDDNPNNYFFHERMADELARRNNLPGALEHYSEAIRILPSRALFYNNRANVYTDLGKKEEALRDFDSAIVRSGNDPRVYLNRCMTLVKLKEFDAAMSELKKLKQCCQQMIPPEAEREITMRWTMNGFAKIDELLKTQPNNAVLYANRAKLLYDIGRKSEAFADKQKAISLAPDNEQIKKYLENIQ